MELSELKHWIFEIKINSVGWMNSRFDTEIERTWGHSKRKHRRKKERRKSNRAIGNCGTTLDNQTYNGIQMEADEHCIKMFKTWVKIKTQKIKFQNFRKLLKVNFKRTLSHNLGENIISTSLLILFAVSLTRQAPFCFMHLIFPLSRSSAPDH